MEKLTFSQIGKPQVNQSYGKSFNTELKETNPMKPKTGVSDIDALNNTT